MQVYIYQYIHLYCHYKLIRKNFLLVYFGSNYIIRMVICVLQVLLATWLEYRQRWKLLGHRRGSSSGNLALGMQIEFPFGYLNRSWASLVAQQSTVHLQSRRCKRRRFSPWVRKTRWRRAW